MQSTMRQQHQQRCPARRAGVAGRTSVVQVRAAKTANGPVVAVVGVTGAVGQEFLTVRLRAG